jgi:hypothetical protein
MAATDARDLQPVRLFLTEMVLAASVTPGDERMTDILNRGGELPVLLAGADPRQEGAWMEIPIDQIQMVVPPPHVSPPDKRMARERHEVRMRVGEWEVMGIAHMRPGSEMDAFLLSTQPFMPLTDATLASPAAPFGEAYPVVIVNLREAEFHHD